MLTENQTIICLDAAYEQHASAVAGVYATSWTSETGEAEAHVVAGPPPPYEPGEFYRRELPLLLRALRGRMADVIVIDGYVHLSADGAPGLGARLYDAIGGAAAVVGVAKNPFRGEAFSQRVRRGGSESPLFVTAAGCDASAAAALVGRMHGAHRIPTLLGLADRAARRAV